MGKSLAHRSVSASARATVQAVSCFESPWSAITRHHYEEHQRRRARHSMAFCHSCVESFRLHLLATPSTQSRVQRRQTARLCASSTSHLRSLGVLLQRVVASGTNSRVEVGCRSSRLPCLRGSALAGLAGAWHLTSRPVLSEVLSSVHTALLSGSDSSRSNLLRISGVPAASGCTE